MSALARTYSGAFSDRLVSWLFGLRAEEGSYSQERREIPLPDGAVLAATLYLPSVQKAHGTILIRSPYGRGFIFTLTASRLYAARGYQVLLVSSRGTFGSTGAFDGGSCEAEDGQNVVRWMRQQPWYSGSFATVGASYQGFTQWALLSDPPHDMVAAAIPVAPHDYAEQTWGTGALNMLQHVAWTETIIHQETAGIRQMMNGSKAAQRLSPVFTATPLVDSLKRHFDGAAPWLIDDVEHEDINDPYWTPRRSTGALDKVTIPVLLITGWNDVFFRQTMEQYRKLHAQGCRVALTVGPWEHFTAVNADTTRQMMQWVDEHMAKRTETPRATPVRIFNTGPSPAWIELPEWPPATSDRVLFLGAGEQLEDQQPASEELLSFVFDPADPTPTIGGPMTFNGGSLDDSSLALRSDTLAFTSRPLTEPLTVFGQPLVELCHSNDAPSCDLFIRLSEVDSKGTSRNITEDFRRLRPSSEAASVKMVLADIAHTFQKGSRLSLIIAGGWFPKYSVNHGMGEATATGTGSRSSQHTIHCGGTWNSRLVFPVRAD